MLPLLRFSFKVNFEILGFRPAAGLKVLKQLVEVVVVCLLLFVCLFVVAVVVVVIVVIVVVFMMNNMSLKLEEISKQRVY